MEKSNEVKFPNVKVKLVGEDGNAFAILGRVSKALKKGGATKEQVDEYFAEATAAKYCDLLSVTMQWVDVS